MANKRITDYVEITTPDDDTIFYIVDPDGATLPDVDRKIKFSTVRSLIRDSTERLKLPSSAPGSPENYDVWIS